MAARVDASRDLGFDTLIGDLRALASAFPDKRTGRGRQDRDHSRHNAAPKRIFVYPLRADARQALASGL
jgi:hypothetical protein